MYLDLIQSQAAPVASHEAEWTPAADSAMLQFGGEGG